MGKHKVVKKSSKYSIQDGKVKREGRACPKCGTGVFMAKHGDRLHCGRCGYTEFPKQGKQESRPEPKQEAKPEAKQ